MLGLVGSTLWHLGTSTKQIKMESGCVKIKTKTHTIYFSKYKDDLALLPTLVSSMSSLNSKATRNRFYQKLLDDWNN